MTRRIVVSLSEAEAEALLAAPPDSARSYEVDPVALLHARGKLIDRLLDRRDYVPPAHREAAAAREAAARARV